MRGAGSDQLAIWLCIVFPNLARHVLEVAYTVINISRTSRVIIIQIRFRQRKHHSIFKLPTFLSQTQTLTTSYPLLKKLYVEK